MKHAIIVSETPTLFNDSHAVDSNGVQHPWRKKTKAEKLELGVHEVTQDYTISAGHVMTGTELVVVDGEVVERATTQPRSYATSAEAKAAMVAWIDGLTAQVMDQYPRAVQARWSIEEAAARAFKADDGTATQDQIDLVTTEGAAKNRTPIDHADAIIANADRFRAIADQINTLFLATDAALQSETDPAQYAAILDNAIAQAAPLAQAYGLDI